MFSGRITELPAMIADETRLLLAVLMTGVISACDMTEPQCTANIAPSIVVEIRDSANDSPLAGNAEGEIRDGAYVDSLKPYGFAGPNGTGMVSRYAGQEQPGRFDVEVRLAGYSTWTAKTIRVSKGECHVGTVTLHAHMQPVP
jgi:hypothetical protein